MPQPIVLRYIPLWHFYLLTLFPRLVIDNFLSTAAAVPLLTTLDPQSQKLSLTHYHAAAKVHLFFISYCFKQLLRLSYLLYLFGSRGHSSRCWTQLHALPVGLVDPLRREHPTQPPTCRYLHRAPSANKLLYFLLQRTYVAATHQTLEIWAVVVVSVSLHVQKPHLQYVF